MILDMDTLYRIHSNEHSRYVTVRAHQHRHRPAPTPLANAQETIDFSLTLSGSSWLILNRAHSHVLCRRNHTNTKKKRIKKLCTDGSKESESESER